MARAYQITARRKVGRQNIGPLLAWAMATGERAQLIEAMRARYPHARISAHEDDRPPEAIRAEYARFGGRYATAEEITLK